MRVNIIGNSKKGRPVLKNYQRLGGQYQAPRGLVMCSETDNSLKTDLVKMCDYFNEYNFLKIFNNRRII